MSGISRSVIEYIKYHKEYTAMCGTDNLCILYRKGKFYEMYGLDGKKNNDNYNIDLSEISDILDCNVTCENKHVDSSKRGSYENPYLVGIHESSFEEKVNLLIENNYKVIVIDN